MSGTVIAEGRIVLEAKAVFEGDMTTKRLVVDDGAILEGQCSMKEIKSPTSPTTTSGGPTSVN